jgi:LuxR family maltose regulon positive regulatory protein
MPPAPPVTKFTPPRLPSTLVDRASLIARLEIGSAPVTLVMGFAGAGKTVLMTAWLDAHPERVAAWLSCDSWDSDAERFWTSVITALRRIAPDVGTDALDWIGTDGAATLDSVASLVNDLNALVEPTLLVIDDLHVVSPASIGGLTEFLERLPPNVRVVIGSRSEPVLPLHRWRVNHRLAELRDVDLRLEVDEAEAMLSAFGVRLLADDIEMLTKRTEGWAAGLQLAALSLHGRDDAASFVHLFAGNNRGVADFLVGEVLARQEPHVVDFLMATSIVDQLDAELCDYLTGRDDSVAVLRAAEATGLFVLPIDNERRAYRYHQLFRDLLRAELYAADRDRANALHLRAARWYEDRGDVTAAMQHRMRGGDVERSFAMLHEHLLDSWWVPTSADLGAWLDELSMQTVVQERGRILDFGLGLALAGRVEAASFWLERADDAAMLGPPRDNVFEARRELALSVVRGLQGDAESAAASATRALDLVPRGIDTTVDAAPIVLLRALLWLDDLDAARRVYEEAAPGWTDPTSLVILRGALALVEFEAGNLRSAKEHAQGAFGRGLLVGVQDHPGAVDTRLTLGNLALEHNELDEAERWFEQAVLLAESVRVPFALLGLLGLAQVSHARGEWQLATAMIERAREVLPLAATSPLLHMVNALDARFALSEDHRGRVEDLIDTLPVGPRRSLLEARSLLAFDDVDAARGRLHLIRAQPLPLRRDLEVMLLEARIAEALGEDSLPLLERAVELARPEGFVRTLVASDPVVTRLLADFLRRAPRDPYTDTLMAAVSHTAPQPISRTTTMVEDLSQRERAVLRWLPTRLTAREIAGELFISMNTLKSHLKTIYRKLDATSRADAVARAVAHGLLPATQVGQHRVIDLAHDPSALTQ